MPGLVPGIHVFLAISKKDVDGRVKPGHDENDSFSKRLGPANGPGFSVMRYGHTPDMMA